MGKKNLALTIASIDEADRALQRIGELRREIAAAEQAANAEIDAIRARLVLDTKIFVETLERDEAALEVWAAANKELFKKPRSLELNFGKIGFKLSPWKVVILGRLKAETVIEKIRAAKMISLIRPKFEINRDNASNYLNSDLAKVGLRKVRSDEFFFECKEIEVSDVEA